MGKKEIDKNGMDIPKARRADLGDLTKLENVIDLDELDGSGNLQPVDQLTETSSYVAHLAKQFGIPSVDLTKVPLTEEIVKIIPANVAKRYGLIPINVENDLITIVTNNPEDAISLMDYIKHLTGFKDVEICVGSQDQVEEVLRNFYNQDDLKEDTILDLLDNDNFSESDIRILEEDGQIDLSSLEKDSKDDQIVRFVNLILVDAVRKGASDIHIEGFEDAFRIRYRIDGALVETARPPSNRKAAIVSRIKVMSQMDISERRLPQDGRIKLLLGKSKDIDFRVSVLPTIGGENVTLRILDKSALQLNMLKLGFNEIQLREFKTAISQPWGMVLVTGPTGSGKTTTLYSALMELNKPSDKILTVEDPVEIRVNGICQVHINEAIGLNFATALRSFLRQDPDIIMVGEIRDFETAEIATQSALTGHLVLSTLHTNDAPSTVNRLLNMGIEPFLVSSAVNLILAQRLVRKICPACKEPLNVNLSQLQEFGINEELAKQAKLFHGKGCKLCNNTGYKGRIALYEVMTIGDELKEGILQGYSAMELRREAVRLGMIGLRESGIEKVLAGETTLEEVVKVTRK